MCIFGAFECYKNGKAHQNVRSELRTASVQKKVLEPTPLRYLQYISGVGSVI